VPGLDRRRFLLGSGAVLLAACSGGDDEPEAVGPTTTTAAVAPPPSVVLGTAFNRNTYLQAGIAQRATFVLFEESGGFVRTADAPDELTFQAATAAGGQAEATAARHGDELDRPYYPTSLTLPTAGVWAVSTALPDGTTLGRDVQVNPSVPFPQVGDGMPSAATPTVDDPLGVATICTRTPACPFHEISLADALAEGRPTAVIVSTPAYCQVAICGPVLDLLIDADPADVTVIHLEAFPNGTSTGSGTASPVLTDDFQLDFEPVLYVAGADGTITARLDSIYDSAELASALSTAG
jgi:hypothetical protein